ncbi:hypothetical protein [Paenibacillus sp. y28]|uniref:hypothetical protein n=1 Tax=Paenibacillus sp. y28 TaxID=3129110 RepID=UPI00301A0536
MSLDFEELMDEAYALPNGAAKIALLEEAARLADSGNDIEQGYEARTQIVEAASFGGFPMKAIVAFSWQLGQFDKQPDLYDSYDLLWSYKWILGKVCNFPEISLQQIENLLEDLRKRYREAGYSDRTYYYYRFRIAMDLGDGAAAGKYFALFSEMERDLMSDCRACEQQQIYHYYVMIGEDERALKAAEPILAGQMKCAEIPHITLAEVLAPLYRLGRTEEAIAHQRKGYRLIKGNRDFLNNIGGHIHFLAQTDPLKGLEVFEQHVAQTLDHEDPCDKMMFYAYSAGLFRRLAENGQVKQQPRLPEAFPYLEDAADFRRLSGRFEQLARTAADQYDRRNGNSYYSTLVSAAV